MPPFHEELQESEQGRASSPRAINLPAGGLAGGRDIECMCRAELTREKLEKRGGASPEKGSSKLAMTAPSRLGSIA
jgi:hypothetical protein